MTLRLRLLAAILLAGASRLDAQVGVDSVTVLSWLSSPRVLRLPASARALAMGNAFVAGRGSEMLFYNPAQLSIAPGLGTSVERFGSASTLGALSASSALGAGGVGVGAQMLDYDAGGSLTTSGPPHAASLAATAGLAYPIKGIRWGVAGKYVQERFANVRGGAAAVDLGAAKDVGPVTVGLAAQNLGGQLRAGGSSVDLPQTFSAGVFGGALPVGPLDLTAGASVSVPRHGRTIPAVGAELGYTPLDGYTVAVRGGVRRATPGGPGALTLGAGFSFDRLSLDYAYEAVDGPGSGHRVGIRIR